MKLRFKTKKSRKIEELFMLTYKETIHIVEMYQCKI